MFDWLKRIATDSTKEDEVRKRQEAFKEAVREAELAKEQREVEAAQRERDAFLNEIRRGVDLPIIESTLVVLGRDEVCHFGALATRLMSKKITVGYEGSRMGVSYRVARGVRVYSGGARGCPVKQDVMETHKGVIVITSKRIVFVSSTKGFTIPFAKLVAIIPYSDGYGFQKDNNTNYLVQLSDPEVCVYFGPIIEGAINRFMG